MFFYLMMLVMVMVLLAVDGGVIFVFVLLKCQTTLKRSRFGFAPQGLGLHSYRLLEVMAAGAIPVLMATYDNIVLPYQVQCRKDVVFFVCDFACWMS